MKTITRVVRCFANILWYERKIALEYVNLYIFERNVATSGTLDSYVDANSYLNICKSFRRMWAAKTVKHNIWKSCGWISERDMSKYGTQSTLFLSSPFAYEIGVIFLQLTFRSFASETNAIHTKHTHFLPASNFLSRIARQVFYVISDHSKENG